MSVKLQVTGMRLGNADDCRNPANKTAIRRASFHRTHRADEQDRSLLETMLSVRISAKRR